MLDLEDTLAMEEFGMMFDQLGDNEKEWVWDEMSKMEWSKDEVHRTCLFPKNFIR